MFASVPPALLSPDSGDSEKPRANSQVDENVDNCDTTRGVTVPVLNIDSRVDRGIQVFTALGSMFIIGILNQVSKDASVYVLFLLILLMFFFERLQSECKSAAKKWAPKAFANPIITLLKVLEFVAMLTVYVVVSYATILLSGLWIDGNLSIFEAGVIIVIGVAITYTVAVAYHDVRNTLERAIAQRKQQQQQQQQQSIQGDSKNIKATNARSCSEVSVV